MPIPRCCAMPSNAISVQKMAAELAGKNCPWAMFAGPPCAWVTALRLKINQVPEGRCYESRRARSGREGDCLGGTMAVVNNQFRRRT
jgi:hypothetical protein